MRQILELPRDSWDNLSTENKRDLLARFSVVLTKPYQDA